jgi:hypothetical protein
MYTIKHIIRRRWGYILVALISGIGSFIIEQPTWWLAIVVMTIGVIEEYVDWRRTRQEKRLNAILKLKEMVQDFNRFVDTGYTYSIFYIIREFGNAQSDKTDVIKEWAEAHNTALDFLLGWLSSTNKRLSLITQLKTNNEIEFSNVYKDFQRINHYYFKIVDDFYRKSKRGNISENIEKNYNKFVDEYNSFVRNFRNLIGDTKKVINLETNDPNSIDFAEKLNIARWG